MRVKEGRVEVVGTLGDRIDDVDGGELEGAAGALEAGDEDFQEVVDDAGGLDGDEDAPPVPQRHH